MKNLTVLDLILSWILCQMIWVVQLSINTLMVLYDEIQKNPI
jgi:hypothetical protein